VTGITVSTTNGMSTYAVKNGTSWNQQVTVTGELAVDVIGTPQNSGPNGAGTCLASFGNVEVVFLSGEVENITPAESEPSPQAGVALPSRPWA